MWDLIGLVRPINPFANFGDITRKIKKSLNIRIFRAFIQFS